MEGEKKMGVPRILFSFYKKEKKAIGTHAYKSEIDLPGMVLEAMAASK
jgi:hypothetical protein